MVGDGVRLLCERAAPGCSPDQIKDLVGLMRAHYAAHGTDLTRPYAGITQLLGDLATRGLVLAVLSNKPDDFTGQLVSHYFGRSTFQVVRGLLPDGALKPDPEAAWAVANEVGISPARWLYLGDTDTDMRTACAAGMTAVGVLWGFRDAAELKKAGAQHLAAAPADVLRLV